jgi:hypothetical protein
MIHINFCYQTTTPESAEHGDFESQGYITPGTWALADAPTSSYELGDLRHLIAFAESLGIYFDGDNAYSVEPYVVYETGDETTYSMHIEGCTDSTWCRIMGLLPA